MNTDVIEEIIFHTSIPYYDREVRVRKQKFTEQLPHCYYVEVARKTEDSKRTFWVTFANSKDGLSMQFSTIKTNGFSWSMHAALGNLDLSDLEKLPVEAEYMCLSIIPKDAEVGKNGIRDIMIDPYWMELHDQILKSIMIDYSVELVHTQ